MLSRLLAICLWTLFITSSMASRKFVILREFIALGKTNAKNIVYSRTFLYTCILNTTEIFEVVPHMELSLIQMLSDTVMY